MITDPRFAPNRTDLPFLRKRVRPKPPAVPPAADPAAAVSPRRSETPSRTSAAAPAASGPTIDYTRHDREQAAPGPAPSTSPPAAGASPQQTPPHPTRASPATPPAATSPGTSPATSPGETSASLDLSVPAAPSTRPAAPRAGAPVNAAPPAPPVRRTPEPPPPLPAWMERHVTRVTGPVQQILRVQDPTVTLTRVQSGIGQLLVEAVCSPAVGDLRLGAAFQLRSGISGIVAQADGNRFGPSSSRRPVIVGSREEYERLGIDLRQTTDIERIAVFAFSESRTELTWGGTLVAQLEGGARLEIPLERLYPGRIAMLMTLYNLHGELVVRAEMETIVGDVREAARAYGYDRITWRDDRHPVD